MKRTIFGNDLDETACWITAFSLYLSLLERLEPTDISLLQTDSNLKLPNLVGPGRNIQKGARFGDFFSTQNPFAGSAGFDVFLCNPPWRESDDDEKPTWETWCQKQQPPYPIGRRQIAAGFAYRAMQSVKPSGVATLIMPLNLIIGASPQSQAFRQRLLEDARIERIINFGDVRRLLFPAAKHPCAVVRVRPRVRQEGDIALAEEGVEYWTPKTDVSLALGRLALHSVDRKKHSARAIYEEPYLLISSYWGEKRDLDLIRRLKRFGTVAHTMHSRPGSWISGKGFHAPNQSNPNRSLGALKSMAYLSADRLPDNYPVIAKDIQLDRVRDHFAIVASPGGRNTKLYSGPRVVFPDGLGEGYIIRSVFSDVPFAFTSSIGAIGGPKTDASLLKFLAAYLRSPLASWLLVMTGYSVIGERPRVAIDDVEAFPFCAPASHPDPNRASAVIDEMAKKFDDLAAVPEWQRDQAYDAAAESINELVYDYFLLTEADRIVVGDTVKYFATSIQPPDYERLTTPLLNRPTNRELQLYTKVLSKELATWRARGRGAGGLEVQAIIDGTTGFFGAVEIKIVQGRDAHSVSSVNAAFQALLSDLHAGFNSHTALHPDELFKIPNVMVFANDRFYFVKPMRRRFWLPRAALADADQIAQTVHAAVWK
jgi:hypothetical protein